MDKKLFTAESVIGLKNPEKSFPLNNDVGVLKWRLQTTDESLIPLTSKYQHMQRCSLFVSSDDQSPVGLSDSPCRSFYSKLLAFRERYRL